MVRELLEMVKLLGVLENNILKQYNVNAKWNLNLM